jgi:hypothetical protein
LLPQQEVHPEYFWAGMITGKKIECSACSISKLDFTSFLTFKIDESIIFYASKDACPPPP